ncbi:hypothetical protein CR513_10328, partial [Mucuna pruriens]
MTPVKFVIVDTLIVHHHFANQLAVIREFVLKDGQFKIQYTLRERNQCVYFLTKIGAKEVESIVVLPEPPTHMRMLLVVDEI